jgi:hypothetical protein
LRRARPDRRRPAATVVAALSAAVAVGALSVAPVAQAKPGPSSQTPSPAPAPVPPASGDSTSQYADPFTTLGATSPFCGRPVGRVARLDCRVSRSVAHPYPISSYGLDQHVPTGVTDIGDNVLAALQMVAEFVWFALVLVIKGVLLLLEWAFSLDLLNSTMASVKHALDSLHNDVLGRPWFLLAVSVAGLWGIWRGLVQRRTIETLGGLAATVALMLVALVLISDPTDTVGHASQLTDEAALGVVSGASSGDVSRPEQSFATALEGVFRTTVEKPWAALEFGDTRWALSPAKPGSRVTNADVWLAFPAGSSERSALYKLQKGSGSSSVLDVLSRATQIAANPVGDAIALLHEIGSSGHSLPSGVASYVHKDPSKVRIQEAGGTFPRLALLVLVAIGLTGAILLFLYVGVKLLLASVMSLLLVLLAPAMLLAPAFGQSGRATTIAWAKRLAGALAAKLIYALLLAVLLVASSAIDSLQIGWFGTWLILIAFWWGALLKRRELVGFVSVGQGPRDGGSAGGGRTLRALYALRIAGAAVSSLRPSAEGPRPRRPPPYARHPGRDVAPTRGTDTDGAAAPRRAPQDADPDADRPTAVRSATDEHRVGAPTGDDPPRPAGDRPAPTRPHGPATLEQRPEVPAANHVSAAGRAAVECGRLDPRRDRVDTRMPTDAHVPVDPSRREHAQPSPDIAPSDSPRPAAIDAPRPIDHREHLAALAERRRALRDERSSRRPDAR